MNKKWKDKPKINECLRHIDGTLATVEYIAVVGKPHPQTPMPVYENDVFMCIEPGITRICSGGDYFWTKWSRITAQPKVALVSMLEGLGQAIRKNQQ
jgi:hypothetical protein